MTEAVEDIQKKRARIDSIDTELIKLITERAQVAKDIGTLKQGAGIGVVDPEREKKVLSGVKAQSKVIPAEDVEAIWGEIISVCKKVQGYVIRVGYLGPRGTFTEEAAHSFFPKAGTEFVPAGDKWEIFNLIDADKVEYGVIPVENSLQGSVPETLDLLVEKNIKIYGETELRVIHNVIANLGAKVNDLKKVLSHPQALSQTREWLRKNLPNVEQIETSSTARAVEMIEGHRDWAAIGNALAAELYKKTILEKSIEDNPQNYTRFLVISKQESFPTEKSRTSIIFVIRHVPGALFESLKIFATRGINLLKIESRPRRDSNLWDYSFFLDFEGHHKDPNITAALSELEKHVMWLKLLGSYPRSH